MRTTQGDTKLYIWPEKPKKKFEFTFLGQIFFKNTLKWPNSKKFISLKTLIFDRYLDIKNLVGKF